MTDDDDTAPPEDTAPPGLVDEEVEGYVAYLRSAGLPADGAREDVSLRTGNWRFCYRSPAPGVRASSTAFHPDRLPVRADRDSEWWELLSDPGVDARRAHQLVAWLMERPAAVEPGSPLLGDREAAGAVAVPSLEVDGDRATFRGWVVYPPNMAEPFLVEISARRSAASSPVTTRWDKVG